MRLWQSTATLAAPLLLLACSSNAEGTADSSTTTTGVGTVGSGGTEGSGGSSTTKTATSTTGKTTTTGAAATSGATSTNGGGGGGAGGAPPVFENLGVCGLRSEGTVTVDSYEAYEEFYLLGDEGFGDDLCVVRFEVVRVGDGPEGCDRFAGQQEECLWTHLVEYQNPTVLLDADGACANSELALDSDAIAALDGKQLAYGYVFEYQGHNSVLMTHDAERDVWTPLVNAGWSEESGALRFDRRDGFCGY